MSARSVFLDRDGVLVEPVRSRGGERPPWSLEELQFTRDARGAVERLHDAGLVLVVVTNQPDIAEGELDSCEADSINEAIRNALGLSHVYMCPHRAEDRCTCRKPLPGMLVRASEELDIDLARSWLIGDRWVDIVAGTAAGTRTALLERPTSWNPTSAGEPPQGLRPDAEDSDLMALVDIVIATSGCAP